MGKLLLGCALCACIFSADCTPRPLKTYVAYGWVRSLWYNMNQCYGNIVFEPERGELFTIRIVQCGVPPVWQGLHCVLSWQEAGEEAGPGRYANVRVVKRLPD